MRVNRFAALELGDYPRRAAVMAAAACAVLVVDFASKEAVVALSPDVLFFNYVGALTSSADASLILVAAACSLLACVLPERAVVLGAGVALGGALGNLASRPRWWGTYGGTPDFIPFADGSTGNLADIFILIGSAAMLLGVVGFLGWKLVGERRSAV